MKGEGGDKTVGVVRVEGLAKHQPHLSAFSVNLTVVVPRLGSTGAERLLDRIGVSVLFLT